MISKTTKSFWDWYNRLPHHIKNQAKTAYKLWSFNLYHPSLHFKRIGEKTASIRIGRSYRALGNWQNNTITWFWIGSHEEYNRLVKGH